MSEEIPPGMEAAEFRTWVAIDDDMTVVDEREGDDDDSEVDHIVESFHSPKDAESNNNVVTTT